MHFYARTSLVFLSKDKKSGILKYSSRRMFLSLYSMLCKDVWSLLDPRGGFKGSLREADHETPNLKMSTNKTENNFSWETFRQVFKHIFEYGLHSPVTNEWLLTEPNHLNMSGLYKSSNSPAAERRLTTTSCQQWLAIQCRNKCPIRSHSRVIRLTY